MSRAVLFYDVGGSHASIVRDVAAAGLRPVVNHPTLERELAGLGVRARRLADFEPPGLGATLQAECARLADGLARGLEEPSLRRAFETPFGDLLPHVAREFARDLLRLSLGEIAVIETFEALCQQEDLALAVLGCDNNHAERALVGAARRRGVTTLQLAHGIYSPPLVRVAGEMTTLYSDFLAAYGSRARDLMVELGNDPARIRLTGCPAWDPLYAPEARLERARARRALGLDGSRPVVLYLPAYVDGSYPHFPAMAERALRLHETLCQAAASDPSRPQLVVRPHPHELERVGVSRSERAELGEAYLEWCAGSGRSVDAVAFDGKLEAIRAADVVVVDGASSVIPEVMILERPVLLVRSFEPAIYGEHDGVAVVEPEALAATLRGLLAEPAAGEGLVARQRGALPDLNFGHDGRASERVTRLILELAEAPARTCLSEPREPDAHPAAAVHPPEDPARAAFENALRELLRP